MVTEVHQYVGAHRHRCAEACPSHMHAGTRSGWAGGWQAGRQVGMQAWVLMHLTTSPPSCKLICSCCMPACPRLSAPCSETTPTPTPGFGRSPSTTMSWSERVAMAGGRGREGRPPPPTGPRPGTAAALSVSNLYLASDETYHPLCAPIPRRRGTWTFSRSPSTSASPLSRVPFPAPSTSLALHLCRLSEESEERLRSTCVRRERLRSAPSLCDDFQPCRGLPTVECLAQGSSHASIASLGRAEGHPYVGRPPHAEEQVLEQGEA